MGIFKEEVFSVSLIVFSLVVRKGLVEVVFDPARKGFVLRDGGGLSEFRFISTFFSTTFSGCWEAVAPLKSEGLGASVSGFKENIPPIAGFFSSCFFSGSFGVVSVLPKRPDLTGSDVLESNKLGLVSVFDLSPKRPEL